MAQTKIQLDIIAAAGCQDPNCKDPKCGTMYLTPRCHPRNAVRVRYKKNSGLLEVECAHCAKHVLTIKVAE